MAVVNGHIQTEPVTCILVSVHGGLRIINVQSRKSLEERRPGLDIFNTRHKDALLDRAVLALMLM